MNLPPVLEQRYLDSNGIPLAGGQLFTYAAGTTTPQATYTDSTGVTPQTNPIVLDSTGSAPMWLNPALSYKFVLEDVNGVVQWTVDQVVGLLTAGAVTTASIAAGAVTGPCLAAGSVNNTNLALNSDASVDANRPVGTNNIQNGSITRSKINSADFVALNLQKFTTGSGTYSPTTTFFVSSANATAAATYTNNGQTFTVVNTISGGTVLQATGTGAPTTSGILTKTSGTGDATITFTAGALPLYARVKMVGGGGGGAGSANGTNNGGTGGTGVSSTFGTSFLTAVGGSGGVGGAAINGGAGGSGTIASGASGLTIVGTPGGSGGVQPTGTFVTGGNGGSSFLGGGASSPNGNGAVGVAGSANTGGGGSGASQSSGAGNASGGGGGGGGGVEAIIVNPSTSYAWAVGAGGTAGTGGAGGNIGGAGGSGIILVEEYFQ